MSLESNFLIAYVICMFHILLYILNKRRVALWMLIRYEFIFFSSRKIVSESQVMVNGLDSNGINEAFPKPSPFSSFPTPTQSAWPSFVDKLFGSNQPKQTQSNIDKEEVTSEGNGEDEHLTEQILPESSNAYETETVGTESKDEDTNNEDVFTKSTNSPDHKESSDSLPSLSESANLEGIY